MNTDVRPVLSPQTLLISPAEHAAILEVRELFATGAFHHDPDCEADKPNGFNMEYPAWEDECGTTCCIGGWMWKVMSRDWAVSHSTAGAYVKAQRKGSLGPLFFPVFESDDLQDCDYSYITPGAALKAIDSYLATGNPNWDSALGADCTDTTL
jgi:hypothetical protein